MHDNNNLEEVSTYKYLRIDFHHKLGWNYSIEKRFNGGWNAYFGHENNCKLIDLLLWDKKKLYVRLSSLLLSCTIVKFRVVSSLHNHAEGLKKSRRILHPILSYHPRISESFPHRKHGYG